MNIPLERLEAAKSFTDHPFVKKNHDKLLKVMNEDKSFDASEQNVSSFVSDIENQLKDAHKLLAPYTLWILRLYMKKRLLWEDLVGTIKMLDKFDSLRRKKKLDDDHDDINKIKTTQDLHGILELYSLRANTVTDEMMESLVENGDAEIINSNNEVIIVTPKTFEGAKALTLENDWCTAQSRGPWNEYTSEGNLYIVFIGNKPEYQPEYQFHIYHNLHYIAEVTDRSNRDVEWDNYENFPLLVMRTLPVIEFGYPVNTEDRIDIFKNMYSEEELENKLHVEMLDLLLTTDFVKTLAKQDTSGWSYLESILEIYYETRMKTPSVLGYYIKEFKNRINNLLIYHEDIREKAYEFLSVFNGDQFDQLSNNEYPDLDDIAKVLSGTNPINSPSVSELETRFRRAIIDTIENDIEWKDWIKSRKVFDDDYDYDDVDAHDLAFVIEHEIKNNHRELKDYVNWVMRSYIEEKWEIDELPHILGDLEVWESKGLTRDLLDDYYPIKTRKRLEKVVDIILKN